MSCKWGCPRQRCRRWLDCTTHGDAPAQASTATTKARYPRCLGRTWWQQAVWFSLSYSSMHTGHSIPCWGRVTQAGCLGVGWGWGQPVAQPPVSAPTAPARHWASHATAHLAVSQRHPAGPQAPCTDQLADAPAQQGAGVAAAGGGGGGGRLAEGGRPCCQRRAGIRDMFFFRYECKAERGRPHLVLQAALAKVLRGMRPEGCSSCSRSCCRGGSGFAAVWPILSWRAGMSLLRLLECLTWGLGLGPRLPAGRCEPTRGCNCGGQTRRQGFVNAAATTALLRLDSHGTPGELFPAACSTAERGLLNPPAH